MITKKMILGLVAITSFILVSFQNCGTGFTTLTDIASNSSNAVNPTPVSSSQIITGKYSPGTFNLGAATLAQTMLFASWDPLVAGTMVPNPMLVNYEVNMPLWTDGAIKNRWMAIPAQSSINNIGGAPTWTFPNGSVFVKQFNLTMSDGSIKRIETRVATLQNNIWVGYLYKWKDDGSDALLVTADMTDTYLAQDPNTPAQSVSVNWNHSVTNCAKCHSQAAGYVLGVNPLQLNKSFNYKVGARNQIKTFSDAGLLSVSVSDPSILPAYPGLADTTISVQNRARAYLSVNCSVCHQPGGFATPFISIDFRSTTSLAMTNLIGVAPTISLALGAGEARINSGNKALSDVFARMSSLTNGTRMPLVGSSVLHQEAINLIGQWIDSGPQ